MTSEMITLAAERLRALADENRIRILLRLRAGACNITELSADTGIAQPSVSKHVAVLRQVGIVETRRDANQSVCLVRDESVFEICSLICDGVRQYHEDVGRAIGANGRAPRRRPPA